MFRNMPKLGLKNTIQGSLVERSMTSAHNQASFHNVANITMAWAAAIQMAHRTSGSKQGSQPPCTLLGAYHFGSHGFGLSAVIFDST